MCIFTVKLVLYYDALQALYMHMFFMQLRRIPSIPEM